jgi:membrane fusion protein (multidrug efflux system)
MTDRILRGIIAALLLPVWLAALSGCGASESASKESPPQAPTVKVNLLKVEPAPMRDILVLPGETEARHDVILAAEQDGRVEWIGPTEGQEVKKGDLVAKIDVEALKATLDRLEAGHKLAEDVAARRRTLYKENIVSQEAFDKALTEEKLAQFLLREAKVKYEKGFVRSPITGMVNKLHVDPGEFVNRGKPVADLVDVNRIRINVNVPELDVRYLKVGQKALVTIDAYHKDKWEGEVDFVAFKADPASKTFKVRVVVENKDRRIRPGMIARVAFLRRLIPDAIAAPLHAILDKGGERILFVEKDGIAHARTVSIGVIGIKTVQITKGLQPGENLIVTGQHDVEEGMRVSTK